MSQITFKSFLSHRYKSADVNIYFFKLFKESAEVQFEVDEGLTSTNVTRLEKLVRDSDAFIGIYPFPGSAEEAANQEELKKQSRYFRFEIDLAIRSQKPVIIFYDKRYGNLIRPPDNIFSYPFDLNEVTGSGGFPSLNKHRREFVKFCEAVSLKKSYDDIQSIKEKNTIAIVLSNETIQGLGGIDYVNRLKQMLEEHNYTDVVVIQTPVCLNNKLFRLLETIDFAIVEHGGSVAGSGIPAYFHGRFIPMIRVGYANENEDADNNGINSFLFSGVDVGYVKDKVKWNNKETLLNELSKKIQLLNSKIKRINTFDEANSYFLSATLRKEVVFVSYSGKDVDTAKDIINTLKKHYQSVFDYRDGKSIIPGQPWLAEIFDKLAKSSIGINLLSSSYLASGNCLHEAEQMVAHMDSGKMKLFPIKLYAEQLELPQFFGMTQYLRKADYNNVTDLVNEIVRLNS